MLRVLSFLSALLLALSACAPVAPPQMGPDGRPLPRIYNISASDTASIQFRMLDSINSLRQASGAAPLSLDPNLTAAAATHARDIANQNRPWHFGSDGSSPIDRARRAGFSGQVVGETISETYETELETLGAWMDQPDTRRVILARNARSMGFSWHQETNGKIWWTLVVGS